MKVFISGASGFIGKRLTQKLVEQGIIVHALYRDISKTLDLQHPNIVWFKGDITDSESIDSAMKGCQFVFHLAAFAKVWARNKNIYHATIFDGTVNIFELAIKHKVEKVIVTSTAGVFGPSTDTEMVDENTLRTVKYFSDYEKYKDYTDSYIIEKYTEKINFCIVCPSRVYGPGELSASNAATKLIKLYQAGKFHILPGNGKSVGNYVYIEDVVHGIIQALQKGKRGERYILGGDNISYLEFFDQVAELSGKKYKLYKLPIPIIMFIARIMQLGAFLFRIPPLITPGWAQKYLYSWYLSTDKAKSELGYKPTPIKIGFRKTLVWILSQNENKKD